MPRIESLNLLSTESGKLYLAEVYGKVIENVQTRSLALRLRNKEMTGDAVPGGTIVAKRLANAKVDEYGTARKAGKANAVKGLEVPVKIDIDREMLEEVEEKDVKLSGVDNLVERRSGNHEKRMEKDLEKTFFSEAAGAGRVFTSSESDISDRVEAAIQELESTKNDFVDGIDRDMITVVANPAVYGAVGKAISKQQNASFTSASGVIDYFNGARIEKSSDLPVGVEFIVMVDEAVALPVIPEIKQPGPAPFSNATVFGMFYFFGAEAVAPDTILVKTTGTLALTNVAGSTGKAIVTASTLVGAKQYYKTGATVAPPAVGTLYSSLSGFAAFESGAEYTATATHDFVVIEVNDEGKVIRSGLVDSVVVG